MYQNMNGEQRYNDELIKADIDVKKNEAKRLTNAQIHMDMEYKKNLMREKERELKKTQVEDISITPEGIVTVITRNLRTEACARRAANFVEPQMLELRQLGNQNSKAYQFSCHINGEERSCFLSAERMTKDSYLLKKLNLIGGMITVDSDAKEKRFLHQFFAYLVSNCSYKMIPDEPGWYKDINNDLRFCSEEDMTWEKIKDLVK